MDLIPEIKSILRKCGRFKKARSCHGCNKKKCVHGRYIGLILTGLSASKQESLDRALEAGNAIQEIMNLAKQPLKDITANTKKKLHSKKKTAAVLENRITILKPPCNTEEKYQGLTRTEMKECIQMVSGEYNDFDFESESIEKIYKIYKQECRNI
ncbi:MAG: hypothetical protein LBR69_03140 [Endomicrobium sp.]|jgi:hypothetical protein|nr:hypothetical protein [Endomicrobium sp.]